MTFINVGATFDDGTDTARVPSKAALRRHLANNPGDLVFDNTALRVGPGEDSYRASEIPTGTRFQVCGPDPYKNRKWWATIELVGGELRVTA